MSHMIRRALSVSGLALLPLAACAQAAPVRVAFEVVGEHVFMPVEIEGHALSFVFDSAADGAAINDRAARRIGLEPTGTGWISGASGSATVPYSAGVNVTLGTLEIRGVTVVQAPLSHLEELVGREIDGIIGRDVLNGRLVELDHESNELWIHSRRGFPFDDWGDPCTVNTTGSIETWAEVRLLNGDLVSGSFIVDTGAGNFATFDSTFVRAQGLDERVGVTHRRTGRGFTAVTTPDRVGSVSVLNLCGHTFPPDATEALVPVGLSGADAGSLARPGKAGLLGNSLLRRFDVLFDLPRGHIYLRPNASWRDPIRTDGSGLELIKLSNGKVMVNDIVSDSAAASVGLVIGDELRSVDGNAVADTALAALRDTMRQPGGTLALEIVRAGQPLSVELHLRSLLVDAEPRHLP